MSYHHPFQQTLVDILIPFKETVAARPHSDSVCAGATSDPPPVRWREDMLSACLTLAEVLAVLLRLLHLLLQQSHLGLELHPLPPLGGVVTHALQPLPQELVLLAQQRVLGPCCVELHLPENEWYVASA